jgi:YihY family inner membrane protein
VSTAAPVPETYGLSGDDARETLMHVGRRRLLADAFMRLRAADGFSHARSLGLLTSLVLIQAVIAFVGLASLVEGGSVSRAVVRMIEAGVPGPAGQTLTRAVRQARDVGQGGEVIAVVVGLVGAIVTGTTAFGQVERTLNRLYGIERDRPTAVKYARAFLLTLTAGTLGTAAMIVLTFGREIGDSFSDGWFADVWRVVRWPLALALVMAATALLFRWSPRRRQPAWSWLAFGATVSVALWFVVTAGLALFFEWSSSFGDAYGPLAGFVALLFWSLLSAIALFYGAAVAAQLEAVRAHRSKPVDDRRVEEAERAATSHVPARGEAHGDRVGVPS